MENADGPRGVGEPMDGPPGAMAEQSAHQARDHDRGQQLERDHPESKPKSAIGGRERNDRRGPSKIGEGINHRGDDVQTKKDECHQGEVAVQSRGQKTRPAGALHPQRRKDAENDD